MIKLQIQLLIYSIKNNIEAKARNRWYYSMLPPKIAKGFTLAEILITLLIVGTVASLVIPALIAETQNAELKAAWKKSFAEISQATIKMTIDNGGSLKNVFSDNNSVRDEYLLYLNHIKICNDASNEGCWHASKKWHYLNGQDEPPLNGPAFISNNGYLFRFKLNDPACLSPAGEYTRCAGFYIDINGFKGPNTAGRDIFAVSVLENSLLPIGAKGHMDPSITCLEDNIDLTNSGWGCSALYLYQ